MAAVSARCWSDLSTAGNRKETLITAAATIHGFDISCLLNCVSYNLARYVYHVGSNELILKFCNRRSCKISFSFSAISIAAKLQPHCLFPFY